MMNSIEPPLRHIVAPGTYGVQWQLPSDQGGTVLVHGDVDLQPSTAPTGEMAFDGVPIVWETSESSRAAGFPQTFKYPVLRGKLRSNHDVFLLEAVVTTWDPNRAMVNARCALVGLGEPSAEDQFDSMRIQTSFLDRLAGVAPITATSIPSNADNPRKWWAQQAEPLQQVWTSKKANVSLSFDCRARTADPYEFIVRYSPVVTVDLSAPATLDEVVRDWIDPLRGVSTVAMGKKSEITFVALSPLRDDKDETPKRLSYFQLYGSGISQAPFAASQRTARERQPVLRFSTDGISLLALLEGWQLHMESGHPLYETYASVLGVPDDHPRNRFLLLLQALEGHYGHANAEALAEKQEEYKAELTKHLGAIESSELSSGTKKFVKKNISKRRPQGLDTALNWAAKSLPSNVGAKISDSTLVQTVISANEGVNDWSNALRQIRNDLAHGNRSYDSYELHELTRTLDRIVRAHVLRTLGAPDSVLDQMLSAEE